MIQKKAKGDVVPVVMYEGVFMNFILKDWLIETGTISEEDCRY